MLNSVTTNGTQTRKQALTQLYSNLVGEISPTIIVCINRQVFYPMDNRTLISFLGNTAMSSAQELMINIFGDYCSLTFDPFKWTDRSNETFNSGVVLRLYIRENDGLV